MDEPQRRTSLLSQKIVLWHESEVWIMYVRQWLDFVSGFREVDLYFAVSLLHPS